MVWDFWIVADQIGYVLLLKLGMTHKCSLLLLLQNPLTIPFLLLSFFSFSQTVIYLFLSFSMNEFSSNNLHQQGFWWNNTTTTHKGVGVIPQPNGVWGAPIYDNHTTAHSYERVAGQGNNNDSITDEIDNNDKEEIGVEEEEEELEHMFEKPLTPSDVGKLNRLVIPKQHAEKYFPLSQRVDSVEKGLLLSFEDEAGKLWRFRYSYWNSSQSYVLTKGWSRFVKEKQLDAGDVVSFERRRHDGQQLYIRWRRRLAPPSVHDSRLMSMTAGGGGGGGVACSTNAANTNPSSPWTRVYYSAHPYPSHSHHLHGPLLYQPADCLHAAVEPVVQNPVTTGNKKIVRLFGVNLDCELDEPESPGPDNSSYSNEGRTHFLYSQGHDMNHNQQDFNFSREFNQTRNYPGGSGDMPI
ncbi:hypothetical protein AQUCO_07200063v1 [Aquilegia coerulea]|uniref:TF-B3 domain-containing protein n=1 Tax=Aquilegia coerulea TaxID=218851 RepID=A0A2G5CBA8_AQUCA|nr:hypothetical protein AQUCO_07200063v1 [Aquilegia coerulea]